MQVVAEEARHLQAQGLVGGEGRAPHPPNAWEPAVAAAEPRLRELFGAYACWGGGRGVGAAAAAAEGLDSFRFAKVCVCVWGGGGRGG